MLETQTSTKVNKNMVMGG